MAPDQFERLRWVHTGQGTQTYKPTEDEDTRNTKRYQGHSDVQRQLLIREKMVALEK